MAGTCALAAGLAVAGCGSAGSSRITLEHWDRLPPSQQEQVIGRQKLTGAPIGASGEFSPLDLGQRDGQGNLAIPANAHVRLAAPVAPGA